MIDFRQMAITFMIILPAALAGLFLESLGGLWLNSKFFITLLVGYISMRIIHRIVSRKWKFRHEWFGFSIIFPLILGGYIWVREFEVAFITLTSLLFALWLLYVREMVLNLEAAHTDQ